MVIIRDPSEVRKNTVEKMDWTERSCIQLIVLDKRLVQTEQETDNKGPPKVPVFELAFDVSGLFDAEDIDELPADHIQVAELHERRLPASWRRAPPMCSRR